MPTVQDRNGKPTIVLTLNHSFIHKNKFQNFIQSEYRMYFEDFSKPGSIQFDFRFPKEYVYTQEVLYSMLEVLNGYLERCGIDPIKHLDNLLFLVQLYDRQDDVRFLDKYKANEKRLRGKLLVELLRVPMPNITKENWAQYVENGEYLLAYLTYVLKRPDGDFLKNGEIDLTRVDEEQWLKVARRINEDINLAIPLPPKKKQHEPAYKREQKPQVLYFSRDIKIKFKTQKASDIDIVSPSLNSSMFSFLIKMLIRQERLDKTELYNVISSDHFHVNKDSKELTKAVFDDLKESHNAVLKRITSQVAEYLIKEAIFAKPHKGSTSGEIKNFLYKLYLILGFVGTKNNKINCYQSSKELDSELKELEILVSNNCNFGVMRLAEAFKRG